MFGMRYVALIGILVIVAVRTTAVEAIDLTKPLAELRLKDGRLLKNVTFTSYAASAIMAKWDGGRGTIQYDVLPANVAAAASAKRPAASVGKSVAPTAALPKVNTVPALSKDSRPAGPTSHVVTGQVFVTTRGAGAYKFSGATIIAYPAQIFEDAFTIQRGNLPLNYRGLRGAEKDQAEADAWMKALGTHAPLGTATTDADGNYSMTLPSAGTFIFVCSASRLAGRIPEFNFWIVRHSSNRLDLTGQNTWQQPE